MAMKSNREWELRPGGMVVQKRINNDEQYGSSLTPPPSIRVQVKYGSIRHHIPISSQANFGEMKKMLSGPTGLHQQDQKLYYRGKERDSKEFLDTAGVKDKSKLVLVEDPICLEKRYLQMRKNANMDKVAKSISNISFQVDTLDVQVSALESKISKGLKVDEQDPNNLIDLLMNQLLKLDGIVAEGDIELQRKRQVERVQKYVETLDMLRLKMKNATPSEEEQLLIELSPIQPATYDKEQAEAEADVVVTTQWETFDLI